MKNKFVRNTLFLTLFLSTIFAGSMAYFPGFALGNTPEILCGGSNNVIYSPIDLRNYVVGPPGHTHSLSTGEQISYTNEGGVGGAVRMYKNANFEQFIITGNDISRREDTSWAPLAGFETVNCAGGGTAVYTLDSGCVNYSGGGSPSTTGSVWIPNAHSRATGNTWNTASHQIVTINKAAAEGGTLQYCPLDPGSGIAGIYAHPNACGQSGQAQLLAVCRPNSYTFCTGLSNEANLAIIQAISGPGTGDTYFYMEGWGLVGFEAPGFQAGLDGPGATGGTCHTSGGGTGVPLSCARSPWEPISASLPMRDVTCACTVNGVTTCDPFANQITFNRPTNQDIGQSDGTGRGDYSFFDNDLGQLVSVPPIVPNTSGTDGGNGGPPGGGSGGYCNPFNCGSGRTFEESLTCAANALRINEPTWFWFDRYGPYCDNETYDRPNSSNDGLPFGYNFFNNVYDKYVPAGARRTCCTGTSCPQTPPPNPPRPADVGMACPGQSDPLRQPGNEVFDYYRGALVSCPIPSAQQYWTTENSLGMTPSELADHMMGLGINYLGCSLSNASRTELELILTTAQNHVPSINPWILVSMWATESCFGLFQSCGGGGTTPPGPISCGSRPNYDNVAGSAYTIANSLSQGFWNYYNKSSLYPNLFNQTMYDEGNTHPCLDQAQTTPAGCTGPRPGATDLFWCTYTTNYSYNQNNYPITPSLWAETVRQYFENNGRYLPANAPPCALRKGDIVFSKSPGDPYDRQASHVQIIGDIDMNNGVVWIYESNAYRAISAKGSIVNNMVQLNWGEIVGYGTPEPMSQYPQ